MVTLIEVWSPHHNRVTCGQFQLTLLIPHCKFNSLSLSKPMKELRKNSIERLIISIARIRRIWEGYVFSRFYHSVHREMSPHPMIRGHPNPKTGRDPLYMVWCLEACKKPGYFSVHYA